MDCCASPESKPAASGRGKFTASDACRLLLIAVIVAMTAANGLLVSSASAAMRRGMAAGGASKPAAGGGAAGGAASSQDAAMLATWDAIRQKGIPAVYGQALGVSYDDPVAAMKILAGFDPYQDVSKLSKAVLKRYTDIGTAISCEYCCGAQTMVFPDGVAACGCAHSAAMRGLARWLLENKPDMSDADILAELVSWKTLFFPEISTKKAIYLANQNKLDLKTFNLNAVR